MKSLTKLDHTEQPQKSPAIPEEGEIATLTQRIEELHAASIRAARHEVYQVEMERSELEKQRALLIFRRDNRTSFVEASKGDKAVLGVTSGLTLPTTSLPTVPTEQKLSVGTLIDDGARSMGHPARMLEHGHKHGFIAAVTPAFAKHYPLKLKPQHFWLLIAQGVATHVDLNAEAVRKSWVEHEGKKTLEVSCDEFVLGSPTNDWASVVSGKPDSFSAQIAEHTVEGVAEVLAPPFSCTTTAEDIAQKIVVMDICKNFFKFTCRTDCGFPQITLQGTTEDWTVLLGATERLLARCKPEFAASWGKALLPLLDKLVAARKGEVDADFWNSLCKRGGISGSGASTWFNGWMNVFFPYINRKSNIYCTPYSSDADYISPVGDGVSDYTEYGPRGPDCENFPGGMSRAPVIWEYYRREIKLDFNTGFFGASQDPHTFEISPEIGWYITKAK